MAPGFPASDRVGAADPRLNPIYATNLQFFDPAERRNDNRFWGVSGTLDWTTDAGILTIIPAYRDAELDFYSLGASVSTIAKPTSNPAWRRASLPRRTRV